MRPNLLLEFLAGPGDDNGMTAVDVVICLTGGDYASLGINRNRRQFGTQDNLVVH